jgi:hypothetical protein
MLSASVKRVLGSDPARFDPLSSRERGVEYVDPTPAIQAVISNAPARVRRQGRNELGILAAIMGAMTTFMVLVVQREGQPFINSAAVPILWIMGTITAGVAAVLFFGRWRQSKGVTPGSTPEERRSVWGTGPVFVRERVAGLSRAREYSMRAEGSDWMPMDGMLLDAISPIATPRAEYEEAFDDQPGSEGDFDWVLFDATVLYHRASATVLEVHDQRGKRLYRHPDYRPSR